MGAMAERGVDHHRNRQEQYCPHKIEKFYAFKNVYVHDSTSLIKIIKTVQEIPAGSVSEME